MSNLLALLAACAVAAFVSFSLCRIIFSSSIGLENLSIIAVSALVIAAVTVRNK